MERNLMWMGSIFSLHQVHGRGWFSRYVLARLVYGDSPEFHYYSFVYLDVSNLLIQNLARVHVSPICILREELHHKTLKSIVAEKFTKTFKKKIT
jgi:hypothetical protein